MLASAELTPRVYAAYKIPSTSTVSMQVLLRGSNNKDVWRWIGIHDDIDAEYDQGKAMMWNGIVADDQWRYSCFNLQAAIDGMLGKQDVLQR